MTSPATLDARTGQQAVRVLALVVEQRAPLPDPFRLRELGAALARAAEDPICGSTADPAFRHPAPVTSPAPPLPTWPPPAPTSPP